MECQFPEIGLCGASCKLCPVYYIQGQEHCSGCKSLEHAKENCPLLACAKSRQDTEFCWKCPDLEDCQQWLTRKPCDAIANMQDISNNVSFIKEYGIEAFDLINKMRCKLLEEMLQKYDEGKSLKEYCLLATIMEINELQAALTQAWIECEGLDKNAKAAFLHSLLEKFRKSKVRPHAYDKC